MKLTKQEVLLNENKQTNKKREIKKNQPKAGHDYFNEAEAGAGEKQ